MTSTVLSTPLSMADRSAIRLHLCTMKPWPWIVFDPMDDTATYGVDASNGEAAVLYSEGGEGQGGIEQIAEAQFIANAPVWLWRYERTVLALLGLLDDASPYDDLVQRGARSLPDQDPPIRDYHTRRRTLPPVTASYVPTTLPGFSAAASEHADREEVAALAEAAGLPNPTHPGWTMADVLKEVRRLRSAATVRAVCAEAVETPGLTAKDVLEMLKKVPVPTPATGLPPVSAEGSSCGPCSSCGVKCSLDRYR